MWVWGSRLCLVGTIAKTKVETAVVVKSVVTIIARLMILITEDITVQQIDPHSNCNMIITKVTALNNKKQTKCKISYRFTSKDRRYYSSS